MADTDAPAHTRSASGAICCPVDVTEMRHEGGLSTQPEPQRLGHFSRPSTIGILHCCTVALLVSRAARPGRTTRGCWSLAVPGACSIRQCLKRCCGVANARQCLFSACRSGGFIRRRSRLDDRLDDTDLWARGGQSVRSALRSQLWHARHSETLP